MTYECFLIKTGVFLNNILRNAAPQTLRDRVCCMIKVMLPDIASSSYHTCFIFRASVVRILSRRVS